MKLDQIAAQLYTIRDYLKTKKEISKSLEKVVDIGFKAVQISGMGEIAEEELVSICKDLELNICATHENGDIILNQPEKIVERLKKLNCKYTAYPYPDGFNMRSKADIKKLISALDKAGEVLAKADICLTYHNHHIEFQKVENTIVLEKIFSQCSSQNLKGELDSYWVQAGGGNMLLWCKKLAGRLPLLHLKDYGLDEENKPVFKELGRGNLDWPEILAEAELAACQYFIIEQDANWIDNNPFKSLEISFQYLKDFCQ